jgi:hypothetical protein
MKLIITAIIVLTSLFAASITGAQKLYTWTDENGNLHITQDPPPKSAKVEDVVKYRERSPEEETARQRRNDDFRRSLEREKQREENRDARQEAEEAQKEAQRLRDQAQEEYDYNKEYIDKLSNRKWKRKKFRKRIDRLKRESEQSFAEAEAAAKRAEEAKARIEADQESQ